MKLFFEDRFRRLREIADVKTKTEANIAVKNFLEGYNYKSYYTRHWIDKGNDYADIIYDVGSHTEFFRLRFPNYIEAKQCLEEEYAQNKRKEET